MLLEDIFAPPGRINFSYERTSEVNFDPSQIFSQQAGARVVHLESFRIRKFRNLMTEKVIEVCSSLMDNLEKRRQDVPLRLTYIIKLLLNAAHGNEANTPV